MHSTVESVAAQSRADGYRIARERERPTSRFEHCYSCGKSSRAGKNAGGVPFCIPCYGEIGRQP